MSFRRRCLEKGHKWRVYEYNISPYVFCARFFCSASTVAGWVPPRAAAFFYQGIPAEDRVPIDPDAP